MESLSKYQILFNDYLETNKQKPSPHGLYAPIEYILSLGGKRLRPLLALMATEAFGNKPEEALPAALSVEVFHNFTLIHDDIMDQAPIRRGAPSVHNKWNENTGILSGDAMLIQAYQCLEPYQNDLFVKLIKHTSKTALEVCEGQQYDMDFETQKDVSISAYLEMIRLKTAVLVGHSLKIGAWIGNASDQEAQLLYDFGVLLGMAFQIQDDYLDAFGDPKDFGKQVGGDILENKKTILYHEVMKSGNIKEKKELIQWYDTTVKNNQKVIAVKEIFKSSGASIASQKFVASYTEDAFKKLESLIISKQGKKLLIEFGQNLMNRKF
jgi:geranylgeranyl diphosphate synthase type II|tara:strand:+ start:4822 stop:5793 length:972 start_codon:yes stop_codon:yes gene_type:complete